MRSLVFVVLAACGGSSSPMSDLATTPTASGFGTPQLVTITAYTGDAMEPFISSDGQLLFFNDSNTGANTELHWAQRVDDLTYTHNGLLASANSPALDGVPSLADDGTFVFISTRSYATTSSTIFGGPFANGMVSNIALVPGVSRNTPGVVEFDCEVSRDDQTLYYVVSQFDTTTDSPKTADLFVADRNGTSFTPRNDASLFAAINTSALEYAPAIAVGSLELFFTRAGPSTQPSIWVSERGTTNDPFGAPTQLSTLTGYVEGPTISSDGKSLYFHRQDSDAFHIYRVTRP